MTNQQALFGPAIHPDRLTLTEMAELIASGTVPFPRSDDEFDRALLVQEVRHLLRSQILTMIAGIVARDIRADSKEP